MASQQVVPAAQRTMAQKPVLESMAVPESAMPESVAVPESVLASLAVPESVAVPESLAVPESVAVPESLAMPVSAATLVSIAASEPGVLPPPPQAVRARHTRAKVSRRVMRVASMTRSIPESRRRIEPAQYGAVSVRREIN